MKERRKKGAERKNGSGMLTLVTEPSSRFAQRIDAQLVNESEFGFCVEVTKPLPLGMDLHIEKPLPSGQTQRWEGTVCWLNVSAASSAGANTYRAGIELRGAAKETQSSESEEDLYDLLQVSPKADFDTIHRVYRMLAQRFHPDNAVTGDETKFHKLLHAYEVLSNPERRAAYDVQLAGHRRKLWNTFRNQSEGDGIGAERRKRSLILSVMYRKRQRSPEQPYVSAHELEQLLGIEKEHLEFTFWYLREKGFALRSDSGRYSITAAGVEEYEHLEAPDLNEAPQKAIEGHFDAARTPS
jgi:hypothetical protein